MNTRFIILIFENIRGCKTYRVENYKDDQTERTVCCEEKVFFRVLLVLLVPEHVVGDVWRYAEPGRWQLH